jgi:regulator of protease activity HflC (stomatin/prohibitin superfamily)
MRLEEIRRWPSVSARTVKMAAGGAIGLFAVLGSYYVVDPTEMAGVRRLGTVVSSQPVGPGFHLKLPFVDRADKIQVSYTKYLLSNLEIYTVDNQGVNIGIGIGYVVPKESVFRLLYETGSAGNVDVESSIHPVIADRAMRVFSTKNTVAISEGREQIAGEIYKEVGTALHNLFGIQVRDLQISAIKYSDAFVHSVELAVQAKNAAIQAENEVNKIRYEGEQAKVRAAAQAAAAISAAEGAKQAAILQAEAARQSTILNAQGEAERTKLNGEAEAAKIQIVGRAQADRIGLVGAAVTSNPKVTDYEFATRWGGTPPGVVVSKDAGVVPLLNLPTGK